MVKAKNQMSHGKLQPLEVHIWKWEQITMDFITKLLKIVKGFDFIWVIVDRSLPKMPINDQNEMLTNNRTSHY